MQFEEEQKEKQSKNIAKNENISDQEVEQELQKEQTQQFLSQQSINASQTSQNKNSKIYPLTEIQPHSQKLSQQQTAQSNNFLQQTNYDIQQNRDNFINHNNNYLSEISIQSQQLNQQKINNQQNKRFHTNLNQQQVEKNVFQSKFNKKSQQEDLYRNILKFQAAECPEGQHGICNLVCIEENCQDSKTLTCKVCLNINEKLHENHQQNLIKMEDILEKLYEFSNNNETKKQDLEKIYKFSKILQGYKFIQKQVKEIIEDLEQMNHYSLLEEKEIRVGIQETIKHIIGSKQNANVVIEELQICLSLVKLEVMKNNKQININFRDFKDVCPIIQNFEKKLKKLQETQLQKAFYIEEHDNEEKRELKKVEKLKQEWLDTFQENLRNEAKAQYENSIELLNIQLEKKEKHYQQVIAEMKQEFNLEKEKFYETLKQKKNKNIEKLTQKEIDFLKKLNEVQVKQNKEIEELKLQNSAQGEMFKQQESLQNQQLQQKNNQIEDLQYQLKNKIQYAEEKGQQNIQVQQEYEKLKINMQEIVQQKSESFENQHRESQKLFKEKFELQKQLNMIENKEACEQKLTAIQQKYKQKLKKQMEIQKQQLEQKFEEEKEVLVQDNKQLQQTNEIEKQQILEEYASKLQNNLVNIENQQEEYNQEIKIIYNQIIDNVPRNQRHEKLIWLERQRQLSQKAFQSEFIRKQYQNYYESEMNSDQRIKTSPDQDSNKTQRRLNTITVFNQKMKLLQNSTLKKENNNNNNISNNKITRNSAEVLPALKFQKAQVQRNQQQKLIQKMTQNLSLNVHLPNQRIKKEIDQFKANQSLNKIENNDFRYKSHERQAKFEENIQQTDNYENNQFKLRSKSNTDRYRQSRDQPTYYNKIYNRKINPIINNQKIITRNVNSIASQTFTKNLQYY